MNDRQKADLISFIHLIWFLFGIISLPLLLSVAWWHKVVLIFAGITLLSWIIHGDCWLYQAEKKLRNKITKRGFRENSFIQHYLIKFFNINISVSEILLLKCAYVALLVWISLEQFF